MEMNFVEFKKRFDELYEKSLGYTNPDEWIIGEIFGSVADYGGSL